MSAFSKNLRKHRKRCKLTQEKLAGKLNYGYTAIANYESGRNEPSFDDLISLCRILQVTPNDLLGFSLEAEEEMFLRSFRGLLPAYKKIVLDMINALQLSI